MGLDNVLQIGEKIEVRYRGDRANSKKEISYSMVQDVKSGDEIVISLPMLKGMTILLELGQEVEIIYYRDDGCFIFAAKVVEQFSVASASLIRLKKISSVKRLQRRNYFRLKVTLPIYIRELKEDPDQDPGPWLKAYTLNLSGGGARISSNEKLDKGALLECRLELNEEEVILNGKVVRSQLVEDDPIVRYEIGLSFIDIAESDRDSIIKFIFQEQRKLRKKDLFK